MSAFHRCDHCGEAVKPEEVVPVSIGRSSGEGGGYSMYALWSSGPPQQQQRKPIESGAWEFCRLCATGLAVAINAAKLELQKAVREGRKVGPRQ